MKAILLLSLVAFFVSEVFAETTQAPPTEAPTTEFPTPPSFGFKNIPKDFSFKRPDFALKRKEGKKDGPIRKKSFLRMFEPQVTGWTNNGANVEAKDCTFQGLYSNPSSKEDAKACGVACNALGPKCLSYSWFQGNCYLYEKAASIRSAIPLFGSTCGFAAVRDWTNEADGSMSAVNCAILGETLASEAADNQADCKKKCVESKAGCTAYSLKSAQTRQIERMRYMHEAIMSGSQHLMNPKIFGEYNKLSCVLIKSAVTKLDAYISAESPFHMHAFMTNKKKNENACGIIYRVPETTSGTTGTTGTTTETPP